MQAHDDRAFFQATDRRAARDRHSQPLSGAGCDPRMSGNCELGRGLRSREKNATEAAAGRFEKPAPDAKAAPPEAHESLISRKTVEEVPLTGLSFILCDGVVSYDKASRGDTIRTCDLYVPNVAL